MTRGKLTTIFVLITIICLGLSALLLPRSGELAAAAEPLLPFPPSEVTEVVFSGGEGAAQRLVRVPGDRWELRVGESPVVRWPVGSDRARAFLRILDRLRGMPTDAEEAAPAAWLTVVGGADEPVRLGLPSGSLGGRAVVRLDDGSGERAFLTTDELPRLLGPRGFVPWMDARAFAGVEGRVTRVEIASGGGSLVLGSSGGGWRIESPFEAAAEAALVEDLVTGLRMLPVAEGRPEPSEPPSDATAITVTTESRVAAEDGSVTSRVMEHRCVTLGPVSAGGRVPVLLRTRAVEGGGLAGLVSDALGPVTASVDAAGLTELVRQPAFYLARRALRGQPEDVRALDVELPSGAVVRVQRDGAGWRSDGEALDAGARSAIDSLVELITVGVASVAAWSESGEVEGSQRLATITCGGLGGTTLETVHIGVARLPAPAEDTRLHVLLTVGGVLRYYPPDADVGRVVAWLAEMAPPARDETGPVNSVEPAGG
ncbi:MAG: hypothetical protein ACF8LK_05720 [Phycisphaerales bacterium JB041]